MVRSRARPARLPARAAGLTLLLALTAAGAARAETLPQIRRGDLVSTTEAPHDPARPARQRYAIVIGNSDYASAEDLPNARADAALVARFLRAAGFRVTERLDLDRRGFETLLRLALFEIEADSEVVLFYAGHGFQIGGRNYVVPVDADLSTPRDVAFESVTLDSLVAIIGARARLQVIVLDSCRDNPFDTRSAIAGLSSTPVATEKGFSPMAAPVNTLLAFSTAPGAVAYDGEGSNSPYTAAFVEAAQAEAGQPVMRVFEAVRKAVYSATEGRQVPWESSTLVENFAFLRGETGPAGLAVLGTPGGGTLRRLQLAAAAVGTVPPVAPEGTARADLVLDAPLERRVLFGKALVEALGPGLPAEVRVSLAPEAGRLVLAGGDGTARDHSGAPLSREGLAALALEPAPLQVPAGADPAARVQTVGLDLTLPGGTRRVALRLTPSQCDFLAGDHLDPEGIGLTRYPNEIDAAAARAACAAAVAAAPENPRFRYQLGRAELALRNFAAAEAAFAAARDQGYTRAWHALGQLAATRAAQTGGRDEAAADEAAFPFYFEGVRRGDPYAFYALGKQLLRHSGNSELQTIGYDLMSRALEVGHTFAMNELGAFFLREESDHYDPERGLRYLKESAGRGDIYGYNNLGLVLETGRTGIAADPKAAEGWYLKAAEGGHPTAPGNLGRLYQKGLVGPGPDLARALDWFDRGLLRGDARAGAEAAWLIATAQPPGTRLADAALRAARTAALRNARARKDALDLLAQMPVRETDAAAQMLMGELGEAVTADGSFGPASLAAIGRIAARAGTPAPAAPAERAVWLAGLAWAASGFRVDLY